MKYPLDKVESSHMFADSWAYTFVYRQPIRYMTWFFLNFTNITPNQLTTIGFFIGLLSAYLFYSGQYIWGGIAFAFFIMIDYVDGRIAREKKLQSDYGCFLDNYLGFVGMIIVGIVFTWSQYAVTGDLTWLLITPFVTLMIIFHPWEGTFVKDLLGNSFTESVKEFKPTKQKKLTLMSPLFWVRDFLVKHRLQEPFNLIDQYSLLYAFVPIVTVFTGYLQEAFIVLVAIFLLKQVFWFWYYGKIIRAHDAQNKRAKKAKKTRK